MYSLESVALFSHQGMEMEMIPREKCDCREERVGVLLQAQNLLFVSLWSSDFFNELFLYEKCIQVVKLGRGRLKVSSSPLYLSFNDIVSEHTTARVVSWKPVSSYLF